MAKLRLEELILLKFKPLRLSSIEEFRFVPEKDCQLILGTNGCGKSSILRASTPTITDKSEFDTGGSKYSVWVNEEGERFILTSTYDKSVKHSFVMLQDGREVELNPGGTKTIYNELVKKHLKYDAMVHGLLTHATPFTAMNKHQREKLIFAISDCDLTFPMAVYDSLRVKLRDILGAVKRLSVKHTEVTTKLDTFTDVDGINKKIATLRSEIKMITSYVDWETLDKEPCSKQYIDVHLEKLTTLFDSFDSINGRVARATKALNSEVGYSYTIDSLVDKSTDLNNEYNMHSGEKKKVMDDLAKFSEIMDMLEESKDTNLEDLESEVSQLRNKYNEPTTRRLSVITDRDLERYHRAYNQFRQLVDQQVEKVYYVPYSDAKAVLEQRQGLSITISKLNASIVDTETRIDHLKDIHATKVTCTKCDHEFVPGESNDVAAMIETAEEKWAELNVALIKAVDADNEIDSAATNANALLSFITRVREILNGIHIDGLDEPTIDRIVSNESILTRYLVDCVRIGEEAKVYRMDLKRIDKLDELIKLTKVAIDGNVTEKFTLLEDTVTDIQMSMSHCLDFKQNIDYVITGYRKLEAITKSINDTQAILDMSMMNYIKDTNTHHYTRSAKKLETELSALIMTMRSYEDLQNNQRFLDEEYTELEKQELIFKSLIEVISPKTGLIADMVHGTVDSFVKQVNAVLAEVWNHTLELRTDGTVANGLDYIFPLLVDEDVKEDVCKGSTGEQDIINFAVRLVVMTGKNLEGYPLFMDEVGRSFDTVHRTNLMAFTKDLANHGMVGQIFMVNHFSSEYGGISNTDVTILNSDNIDYVGTHNECVEFYYT